MTAITDMYGVTAVTDMYGVTAVTDVYGVTAVAAVLKRSSAPSLVLFPPLFCLMSLGFAFILLLDLSSFLQKSSSSASSEASETCQSVSECSSPTTVSTTAPSLSCPNVWISRFFQSVTRLTDFESECEYTIAVLCNVVPYTVYERSW